MKKAFQIRSELIPPRGAKAVGTHTDGRVIYEMYDVLDPRPTEKVPILDPLTGKEMWKKNQATGEPMYPLMRAVAVRRDKRFVLERDGNGQVAMQEGFEPTDEELAEVQAARQREIFAADLASEAVNRGLNAADVLDLLAGGKKVPANVPGPDTIYPYEKGGGHWILSDGSKFRGTRTAAETAELLLEDDVMPAPQEEDERAAAILEGVEITIPKEEILAAAAEGSNYDPNPLPTGFEE